MKEECSQKGYGFFYCPTQSCPYTFREKNEDRYLDQKNSYQDP